MSTPKDGGPAFPFGQISEVTGQPINGCFNPGMSLRDWFAGQALAGIASRSCDHIDGINDDKAIASLAYKIADAMLAASNSTKQQ